MKSRLLMLITMTLFAALAAPVRPAAQEHAQSVAHRDYAYGNALRSAPTGAGPESKLWWNDGAWWSSLYNPSAQVYHIYRLDNASRTWVDSGTALDNRSGSKADVLWDDVNHKLYVVSHLFNSSGHPTASSSQGGRLYRFNYSAATGTYALDEGFPVTVTRSTEQALTIAKDSRGMLWVSYVENNQVMINHSTTSDRNWGTPFALAAGLASDDLSAVLAFQNNKLGVMWSNQPKGTFSFAVHNDGDAERAWQPVETALGGANSVCARACVHPYINLKTDGAGRVFAAVVTALKSPSDAPRTMLLVRGEMGGWTSHVFGTAMDDHTHPVVLLDEEAGRVHMFATSPRTGGVIYEKTSGLNNIEFSAGLGNAFIRSATDATIDNATSTKQNVSSATGLVVQASDHNTRYYLSATVLATTAPTISSFSPQSGGWGQTVTITGAGFTGTTAVHFNGTAASFTVSSDTQISTTVPSGATTGPISVTNSAGTATSSTNFTVVFRISSFSPTSGSLGTPVTISGFGFINASQVTFNGTSATFTVVSSTQITTSVPGGATTGKIRVKTPQGTATSSTAFTVISTAAPTISSFSPVRGAVGKTVTITGTNFTGTSAVTFNGTPSVSFKGISDTQLSAKVPSGATSGPIKVTNSVGSATSSTSFTVLPKISSFSPTSGPKGTAVTITGSAFTGATKVTFDGVSATFTVVSSTQINTSVPGGATTGKIKVTTPCSLCIATSSTDFTATSTAAPTVSSFSPTSGAPGTIVTITGTNFTGTTGVTFNGTPVAAQLIQGISDTQISVTVPDFATSGPITLTNTVGSATSTSSFTVI